MKRVTRAMNPQPVSLADELRKLVERKRELVAEQNCGCIECRTILLYSKEIDALLEQHAVADVTEAMKSCDGTLERLVKHYAELFTTMTPPPIEEAIKVLKGLMYGTYWCGVEFAEQQAAHAAEQPKLTELLAEGVGILWGFNPKDYPRTCAWRERAKAALLTSPVAPPPQIKGENDEKEAKEAAPLPTTRNSDSILVQDLPVAESHAKADNPPPVAQPSGKDWFCSQPGCDKLHSEHSAQERQK